MKLLLMRHGEAERQVTTDRDRSLTETGEREAEQTAIRLRELGFEPAVAVSSPYIRAQQTAGIVTRRLDYPAALICDAITPDNDPAAAATVLAEVFEDCEVGLAVMHQPIISRLILYLADVDQPMGTADLAVLDAPVIERGCCSLICVL